MGLLLKGVIAVLLKDNGAGIGARLKSVLDRFELNEDDMSSIGRYYWDYWFYPFESPYLEAPFCDEEIKRKYSNEHTDLLNNAIFVRNLVHKIDVSGIITLNGRWLDLQDHGWRLTDGNTGRNAQALSLWSDMMQRILDLNRNAICVRVVVHS